jgi:hypothetical protein
VSTRKAGRRDGWGGRVREKGSNTKGRNPKWMPARRGLLVVERKDVPGGSETERMSVRRNRVRVKKESKTTGRHLKWIPARRGLFVVQTKDVDG